MHIGGVALYSPSVGTRRQVADPIYRHPQEAPRETHTREGMRCLPRAPSFLGSLPNELLLAGLLTPSGCSANGSHGTEGACRLFGPTLLSPARSRPWVSHAPETSRPRRGAKVPSAPPRPPGWPRGGVCMLAAARPAGVSCPPPPEPPFHPCPPRLPLPFPHLSVTVLKPRLCLTSGPGHPPKAPGCAERTWAATGTAV